MYVCACMLVMDMCICNRPKFILLCFTEIHRHVYSVFILLLLLLITAINDYLLIQENI